MEFYSTDVHWISNINTDYRHCAKPWTLAAIHNLKLERIIKYIIAAVFVFAGIKLMFRGLHRLTRIQSKISTIKVEPYYPRHKDSAHYVVTFRVGHFAERLAIYVGDQNQIARSKLIPLLDTINLYTLFIDSTAPVYDEMIVAVNKMVLEGKTIYKKSRVLTLVGGILAFALGICMPFYKRKPKSNGS